MTHTPRPWKVNKFSGRGPLDDEYAVTYTHPNGYVQTIARVVLDHPESIDGVAANAHLIAAAPEMLEALEDMLNGWKYIRQVHGDLYGVGWDRAQRKAEAAIRKARDEE